MERVKTLVARDKRKKEEGLADIVICMAVLIIVILCVAFTFKIRKAELTKANLEDALTASTLAALVFDVDELSATGEICIDDKKTFGIFLETLKTNLELNDDMTAKNPVYYDSVKIRTYTVYNVKGNDVITIRYNPSSGTSERAVHIGGLGTVTAENGESVKSSSAYVKLEISITGFMGGDPQIVTVDNLLALSATNN